MSNKLIISQRDNKKDIIFVDNDLTNLLNLYSTIKSSLAKKKDFVEINYNNVLELIPVYSILRVRIEKESDLTKGV